MKESEKDKESFVAQGSLVSGHEFEPVESHWHKLNRKSAKNTLMMHQI